MYLTFESFIRNLFFILLQKSKVRLIASKASCYLFIALSLLLKFLC
jgi:hypothetical protein